MRKDTDMYSDPDLQEDADESFYPITRREVLIQLKNMGYSVNEIPESVLENFVLELNESYAFADAENESQGTDLYYEEREGRRGNTRRGKKSELVDEKENGNEGLDLDWKRLERPFLPPRKEEGLRERNREETSHNPKKSEVLPLPSTRTTNSKERSTFTCAPQKLKNTVSRNLPSNINANHPTSRHSPLPSDLKPTPSPYPTIPYSCDQSSFRSDSRQSRSMTPFSHYEDDFGDNSSIDVRTLSDVRRRIQAQKRVAAATSGGIETEAQKVLSEMADARSRFDGNASPTPSTTFSARSEYQTTSTNTQRTVLRLGSSRPIYPPPPRLKKHDPVAAYHRHRQQWSQDGFLRRMNGHGNVWR